MGGKANVLVMGNSGAGKSTLINVVFNFDRAAVGDGASVTQKMTIYETKDVIFRLIDTKGLEYSPFAQVETKIAITKWSKDSMRKNNEEKQINIIWYCLDATSKRVFDKNLDSLKKIARLWKNIPIIVVLTKSYSELENINNIDMIKNCLSKYKDNKLLNVVDIVPVVAQQFLINDEMIVPPNNVEVLIEKTNELIPEALKQTKEVVFTYNMRSKKTNSNMLTVTATSGAAVIGAVPIPFADSLVLMPLQNGLIYGISKIYGIKKDDAGLKNIVETIIQCGAVSMTAKTIISALKAVPGLNIAISLINAIVAAIITAVIGEVTIAIMEKAVRGEVDTNDLDWLKRFIESEFAKKINKYIGRLSEILEGKNPKEIGKIISELFKDMGKSDKEG